MKLLIVVHKDDVALDRFMGAARAEKLCGFTLFDSSGIGRTTENKRLEFSIGGLSDLLKGSRFSNSTLLSFVEDERLGRVLELMKHHLGDLEQPGAGLYAVLNVESFGGIE
ncbi:MAG: hypothetical protein R2880_21470 [Deinococcales bacterium]